MTINDRPLTREYLESLTEEELAEMLQAAGQIQKLEEKTQGYIPNPVQERVHRSSAFIRALFSGNGVGKTTACIQEALWTATGTHPHRKTARLPNTTIIVLDDSSKADTVYITQLRKKRWYDVGKLKLEKHGRSYTQEVIFPNGSNWIFMTHEMAEDKWESIECACVIFDEPPPRFIFIALLRGMREKDMRPWIMFAGTPRGRNAPWMYNQIYKPWKFGERTDIECFFGSTDDNLMNLDAETITRWEKEYTEQEMATRRHGSFEFLAGRIFTQFKREVHVEPQFSWPRSWPCILAIDPHLRKNHVAVVLGVDPDKELHVVAEFETSLAGRRAAEFFIRAVEPYWVRTAVCDNFGSIQLYDDGDARKSFIDLFNETARKMGKPKLAVRATTRKEKRDDEWIEDMRDLLRLEPDNAGQARPRFHIFENCVKTIDNFESYCWDEHTGRKSDLTAVKEPKEEPLGANQDYLMCIKYGIATRPDRMGEDKVISRRQVEGKAKEYESHGDWKHKRPQTEKEWMKD